jgi:hypothetical protein
MAQNKNTCFYNYLLLGKGIAFKAANKPRKLQPPAALAIDAEILFMRQANTVSNR